VEKEAKDKQKKENLKSSREKKLVEFRKVWVEEVLPNWEKKYVIERKKEKRKEKKKQARNDTILKNSTHFNEHISTRLSPERVCQKRIRYQKEKE
jgi:hypothetical protein